jgi:hypothetical protein
VVTPPDPHSRVGLICCTAVPVKVDSVAVPPPTSPFARRPDRGFGRCHVRRHVRRQRARGASVRPHPTIDTSAA